MSAQPPLPDASPESQMSYLSDSALPTALIDLRNKHGYVNQVIQYCETAYLTQDKAEIEAQTKEYLCDALGAVVKDIEVITGNLSEFLDLQGKAIDALAPQMDLVKNRISLIKASHAQARLQRSRRTINAEGVRPQKKEGLSADGVSLNARDLPAYERRPLKDRLGTLDEVGHCLSKGT